MAVVIVANKICGVYKIVNTVNNKFYVGSSKDIKNRWKQHIDKLTKNTHVNMHLQMSKYCDSCKEKMKDKTKDWWEYWVDERITDGNVLSWGYNNWDDFWESNV